MIFLKRISILLIGLSLLPLFGAEARLVPCSGTDCTTCDLFLLAQNVFKFVLEIIFAIVVVILVIGGFYLLTSAGNPKNVEKGKIIIRDALIGLAITLCSWLIINTVLWLLTGGQPGEWWKIQC